MQGDEVFPDVEKWPSRAEEMIKETDKFIADEREANRGCFHLKLWYQHSEKANVRVHSHGGWSSTIGDKALLMP